MKPVPGRQRRRLMLSYFTPISFAVTGIIRGRDANKARDWATEMEKVAGKNAAG